MDFQLYLLLSYFTNLTHRTKIKECFSNRLKIEYGVRQKIKECFSNRLKTEYDLRQGSILDQILFDIN